MSSKSSVSILYRFNTYCNIRCTSITITTMDTYVRGKAYLRLTNNRIKMYSTWAGGTRSAATLSARRQRAPASAPSTSRSATRSSSRTPKCSTWLHRSPGEPWWLPLTASLQGLGRTAKWKVSFKLMNWGFHRSSSRTICIYVISLYNINISFGRGPVKSSLLSYVGTLTDIGKHVYLYTAVTD